MPNRERKRVPDDRSSIPIYIFGVDVFRNKDNVHLVASCEFVSHTVMLSTICIEQVS